jgi:hypothetical protein
VPTFTLTELLIMHASDAPSGSFYESSQKSMLTKTLLMGTSMYHSRDFSEDNQNGTL